MVELATVRPCQGESATEVLPKESLSLDLTACAQRLEDEGLDVIDAKALLVITGEVRVTLFPSGRMLVHTEDLELARRHALKILSLTGVSEG
jgi:hypothetical protein